MMSTSTSNLSEAPEGFSDGVSALSWMPAQGKNILAATAWDGSIKCFETAVQFNSVSARKIVETKLDRPVLCCAWGNQDLSSLFVGCCDNVGKMWQPANATTPPQPIAKHDAPIKTIGWIGAHSMVVTGSWDKTVKYWDVRNPGNVVHSQQMAERVYAMDIKEELMVVATADRNISIFDLRNPQKEFKRIESSLKFQTRCIAAFPDKKGFLVGSIEGRAAVQHIDDSLLKNNFTFKCHRQDGPSGKQTEVYPVNSISFHAGFGSFSTTGSDGSWAIWDKENRTRLKSAPQKHNQSIPCGQFSPDGNIFAYAESYDWFKGASGYRAGDPNKIWFCPLDESDVRPKKR